MHDFIGNCLLVGAWVATSGTGNRTAEYGMILGRVISLDPLCIERLTVQYREGQPKAKPRRMSIKNPNKWVLVQPPLVVTTLFDRVSDGTSTVADDVLVGKWIHGQSIFNE